MLLRWHADGRQNFPEKPPVVPFHDDGNLQSAEGFRRKLHQLGFSLRAGNAHHIGVALQEFAQAAFFDRTITEYLADLIALVRKFNARIQGDHFGKRNRQIVAQPQRASALIGELIHFPENLVASRIFGGQQLQLIQQSGVHGFKIIEFKQFAQRGADSLTDGLLPAEIIIGSFNVLHNY
ncbi:hypothetical protein D3C73_936490 [compost metagenome]